MESNKEADFKEKEIIWAKVKEYPWWPGIIKHVSYRGIHANNEIIKEKIYTIDFIGEKNHVKLSKDKIESFMPNFDIHSNTKKPNLLKSIEIAKKLYNKNNQNSVKDFDIKNTENKISKEDKNNINVENNNNKCFLQKKRNNAEFNNIIDNDQLNDKTNEHNFNNNGNNIKINININLTTNNQNTVNINSFQSTQNNNEVKKQKREIDYISEDENEEKENIIDMDDNNIEEKNNDNNIESFIELDSEEDNNNEKIISDEINEIIKKLLNYQIQISNISSQKIVISILEDLHQKIIEFFSNENINNYHQIKKLTKELLPIIHSMTYNKNQDIFIKSSEILSYLTENIIKNIFDLTQTEILKLIDEKIDLDVLENSDIVDIINLKNLNIKNNFLIKRRRSKKSSGGSEISSEVINKNCEIVTNNNINSNNNFFDFDDFIKILFTDNKQNIQNKFGEISENYFTNIYNQQNNGINNYKFALKRKQICIKLLQILRKKLPNINDELKKKIVVFIEYKIRSEDATYGKKYRKKMNEFWTKIKKYSKNII